MGCKNKHQHTHTHVCLINFKTLRFFSFSHHTHTHTRTDWIMYNIYLFWRDDNNNEKKKLYNKKQCYCCFWRYHVWYVCLCVCTYVHILNMKLNDTKWLKIEERRKEKGFIHVAVYYISILWYIYKICVIQWQKKRR